MQTPSMNIHSGGSSENDEAERGAYGALGAGGDNLSSSGTSPRSVSPRVEHITTRTANLLNLDESSGAETDEHNVEELIATSKSNSTNRQQSQQQQQQPSQQANSNNFDILLDFGEPSPVVNNTSSSNAATPVAPPKSDLESLLGGFDAPSAPSTKPATTPTPANMAFDPFGAFDVSSSSQPKSTPPLITPTPLLNAQKSQSGSQGFGKSS